MYNTSSGAFTLGRRVRAMRPRYDQGGAIAKRWYRSSPGPGRPPASWKRPNRCVPPSPNRRNGQTGTVWPLPNGGNGRMGGEGPVRQKRSDQRKAPTVAVNKRIGSAGILRQKVSAGTFLAIKVRKGKIVDAPFPVLEPLGQSGGPLVVSHRSFPGCFSASGRRQAGVSRLMRRTSAG